LIDELWGEQPPATAVSALHSYLSKLRGLVGDLLESGPGGYRLVREGVELDVERFAALLEVAREDPAGAAGVLARARAVPGRAVVRCGV
jgi:DNA-binding SARP family transcriptional activator